MSHPIAKAGAERVWILRTADGWECGDQDGEFAKAGTVEGILPYVRDLLYGPGTVKGSLRVSDEAFHLAWYLDANGDPSFGT